MIDNKRVLAVVVARGGSKGLPRKNVLPLGGKPLIAWSIDAAHGARTVDRTILSTDDPEIIEAARAHGCEVPFVRPAELATDEVAIGPVLLHAADSLSERFDWLVLLQATSPLRTPADIDACVELAAVHDAPVIAVTKPAKSPYWMCTLDDDGRMLPLLDAPGARNDRRQLLPDAYVPNGAIYVAKTEWFRGTKTFTSPETRAYIMPAERSVDIDYWIDMVVAEALLSQPKLQY